MLWIVRGWSSASPHDPVDICILKHRDHPNIKLIRENVSFVNLFTFLKITETDVKRETIKLNPKNSGASGNSTKALKESSYACNLALKNIWNFEMLEKQCFFQNLKVAWQYTSLQKQKGPNLVENYMPVRVLPSVSKIFERIVQTNKHRVIWRGFNTRWNVSGMSRRQRFFFALA